jgi:CheY-like chemotaxis protein
MPLRPRALVVADEPTKLKNLAVRLGGHGYLAVFAEDAEEAVRIARREHPRVVLVDMTMQRHEGVRALERFEQQSFARTPVIALVGAGEATPAELDDELARAIEEARTAPARSIAA